ncbi:MAG: phosphoribosylamine--glycine ligase [Armatimonadota bacterium]
MKVLVVGGGGREHTLCLAISQSEHLTSLYCAPGNGGIQQVAECVPIDAEDLDGIMNFAAQADIDLVVVGPERPLIMGLADRLRDEGILVYGPSKRAAQLEGSKAFTDELLAKYGLSSKRFRVFDTPEAAREYIDGQDVPIVVKADGDAFGKGVMVCEDREQAKDFVDTIMIERAFGDAGDRVVIEECLVGEEATIQVFTDGETIRPMVPSQDHKRIGEGDKGLNTGGMGCYSPVPSVTDRIMQTVVDRIIQPTVDAMASEGNPYNGTLYGGCMLTQNGPEVLEYNCRFGDPEAQVVIPRLQSDLLEILTATAEGDLKSVRPEWSEQAAACVVIASGGYPVEYEKGKKITGIEDAEADELVRVYHAGTRLEDGVYYTDGGRVLGVTALGDDYDDAFDRAYAAVEKIHFEDMYFRSDIGWRARSDKR